MGATLVFAEEFRVPERVKAPLPEALRTMENLEDPVPIEFIGVDEVCYDMSYSRLDRLKQIGETLGIPREAWPDFIDREGDVRLIPIEEIVEKNAALKRAVSALSADAIAQDKNLAVIQREFAAGRMLFITH